MKRSVSQSLRQSSKHSPRHSLKDSQKHSSMDISSRILQSTLWDIAWSISLHISRGFPWSTPHDISLSLRHSLWALLKGFLKHSPLDIALFRVSKTVFVTIHGKEYDYSSWKSFLLCFVLIEVWKQFLLLFILL